MTGRKLDPEAYGGDMSSLLTVLTQAGVLRMEYQGQGSCKCFGFVLDRERGRSREKEVETDREVST